MQVITGKFRGRKLKGVPSELTRPTLGRVKESLFDIINNYIAGSDCLDLFAGSGALGIECLSRGANSVVFVDSNIESIRTIKQNLKNDITNCQLLQADYKDAIYKLSNMDKKFSLVLLDPPFNSDYLEESLYLMHKKELLQNGAMVICEKASKKVLQNYPQKYIINKCRDYGTISVVVLQYNKD